MLVSAALTLSLIAVGVLPVWPGQRASLLSRFTAGMNLRQALIASGTIAWGDDVALGDPFLAADLQHPQQVTGLDADLLTAIAQSYHLSAAYHQIAWDQFPQALRSRTIDLYAGGIEVPTIPPADAVFTRPYLLISDEIVVRAGDTSFTDLASLRGHIVGVVQGDRAAATVKADPRIIMQPFSVLPFEALADGRVDAVVVSSPIARWYVAHDALKRFAILEPEYHIAPVALALSPIGSQTPALHTAFDQSLDQMAADGTLLALLKHWDFDNPLQTCIASARPPTTGCP